MISTFAGYSNVTSDMTRSLNQVREQPLVQRETEYYLENIGNVDTIEELIEDTRLFNYAMRAHGLGDMTYAKAFMVKVLEEGRDSEDSFANSLADTRYREFAETFDFHRYGSSATTFGRAQEGVVDQYLRQTLEEDAGATNEGVRLALYFERKAPELETIYSILADRALGVVVRTALGLPETTALLDIDKQVELIAEKLNLEDLKDPAKLDEFLKRFTNLWELANPSTNQSQTAGLLFGQSEQFGISTELMLTIQQLK